MTARLLFSRIASAQSAANLAMALPRLNPNSFSSLLRLSNFASYDPTIPVLYRASKSRSKEFGLKRPLLNYQSPHTTASGDYITIRSKRLDSAFGALEHEQGFEAFHRWESLRDWASRLPTHKVKVVHAASDHENTDSAAAEAGSWTSVEELRQAFCKLERQPVQASSNGSLLWNPALSSCEPVHVKGRLLGSPAKGMTLASELLLSDPGHDPCLSAGWAVNVAGWIAHWPQTEPAARAGDVLDFEIQQLTLDAAAEALFITLFRPAARHGQ